MKAVLQDTYRTIDQDDDNEDGDDDDDESFFSNNDELDTMSNNKCGSRNILDMELDSMLVNEPIIKPIKEDKSGNLSKAPPHIESDTLVRRRRHSKPVRHQHEQMQNYTDRLVEAIEALRYSINDGTQLQMKLLQHKKQAGSSGGGQGLGVSRRKSTYNPQNQMSGAARYPTEQPAPQPHALGKLQNSQPQFLQLHKEGADPNSASLLSGTATPTSVRHAKTTSIGSGDESLKVRKDKVAVELRVVFLKIGEIDTLKELYHADAFIQAKWREPKLDGLASEQLAFIDLEKYWSPMLYIDNILSETKDAQWLTSVVNEAGEVTVIERRRIKGVFLETLELNDFPLDVQDLTITMTSERPDSEVDLIPDQAEMSAINMQTFVDQQEWKLHEHVEITKRIVLQEYSSTMKSHPCLSVTCRAARRPGYFYWNVFLIMFMISGLSFATFSVSPEKAEYRLRLSFTLVLTSVTFKYVITQSLPKISYLTYMDKYVLMSLAILCIVSIWHACVTLLPQNKSMDMIAVRHSSNESSIYNSNSIKPLIIRNNRSLFNPKVQREIANKSVFLRSFFQTISTKPPNQNDENSRQNPVPLSQPSVDDDEEYDEEDDDANLKYNDEDGKKKLTLKEINFLKKIEKDVLISFGSLYILAHFVFIFWLYFDASKRRRIMKQKDKDYREFLQKNRDWQKSQLKRQQDKRISVTSLATPTVLPDPPYFSGTITTTSVDLIGQEASTEATTAINTSINRQRMHRRRSSGVLMMPTKIKDIKMLTKNPQ